MLINDFIIMAKAANTSPYEYTPETAETDESVEIRTKAFLLDAIKKVTIYLNTIGGRWYFWKGSWASKAHKPGTLS